MSLQSQNIPSAEEIKSSDIYVIDETNRDTGF